MNITETVKIKNELNLNLLNVVRTNARDVDSTNLDVHYKGVQIGYGHLNNKTNFAHITIDEGLLNEVDECDLIDYLVDGIESRSINLQ